ncbi:hypothetical protein MC885_012821, partial [Smutsia gigantea]
ALRGHVTPPPPPRTAAAAAAAANEEPRPSRAAAAAAGTGTPSPERPRPRPAASEDSVGIHRAVLAPCRGLGASRGAAWGLGKTPCALTPARTSSG